MKIPRNVFNPEDYGADVIVRKWIPPNFGINPQPEWGKDCISKYDTFQKEREYQEERSLILNTLVPIEENSNEESGPSC